MRLVYVLHARRRFTLPRIESLMAVKLVFRTDVHASDRSPVSWKGDYPTEIWSSLDQIGEIARQVSAQAVLDGGDYFHTKAASRNSHDLVRRTVDLHRAYPCPVYALVGNHDITYNNLGSLPRQPLGVVFASGVFRPLEEAVFEEGGVRVRVVGLSYSPTRTVEELRSIRKTPEDQYLVVVVHALAGKTPQDKAEDFFREPVFCYRDLVAYDGPDVWCFPPGTPILDWLYRPVPIEQVDDGLAVMDRSGSAVVEAVHPIRMVAEDLVHLSIEGIPPLVMGVTAEHPYWVAKGLRCALPSRAERRCHPDKPCTSYPCSSCVSAPHVEATWAEAGKIKMGDYVAIPVPSIPRAAPSASGLARLLGYYAAEGHIIKNRQKKPIAGVAWSFHAEETALHEDVRRLVREHFGLDVHLHSTSANCVQVCAYSREIAEFFAGHGGSYADRKSLSSWIWQRAAVDRMEFLLGWLLGDGHARNARTEVGGATASRTLAFQVFFLALSIGLRPYFTVQKPQRSSTIRCRDGTLKKINAKHPCHKISFYGDDGGMLSCRLGISPPDRSKTKVAGFFADGLYYARVRAVVRRPYEGPVHNFRTNTGRYVAGGILVHNCFGHWHKDQGITEIDGKLFVNQGAVSRGSLIRENTERTPQVSIIEATPDGISARVVALQVAPASEVFDFERKEKQEREGRDIDQFIARLQSDAVFDPSLSIEENVAALEFAEDVRDLALEYLEQARGETG